MLIRLNWITAWYLTLITTRLLTRLMVSMKSGTIHGRFIEFRTRYYGNFTQHLSGAMDQIK